MKSIGGLPAEHRKILLIAYHFPPSTAVGGTRAANLARCLPDCGWEPYVLTIPEERIEQSDPERLRGLEGVSITRATVLPTLERLCITIWKRLHHRNRFATPSTRGRTGSGEEDPRPALTRTLKRFALSFLELPDRERGWILPASLAAITEMRRHHLDWLMTSCPPYSAHLVGLVVKSLYGGRWVADFRDPWMTTGSKRLYPTSALSRRIESWLERLVVERADLVLFNVPRLRDAYRERYHHVPAEKFAFLPNALPLFRADEGVPASKYTTFTICYTGSIYLGRSPEPVFAAVARLIRHGRLAPSMVQFKLAGDCSEIEGTPVAAVARKYGLESAVEVLKELPYADALRLVKRSHVALLLAPNTPFQIPAKAYDYLAAGTRILALTEEGGTADLVRKTASGRALRPEDIDGIAEFLCEEITSRGAAAPADTAALAEFDMREIARRFVHYLHRADGERGGIEEFSQPPLSGGTPAPALPP